VHWLHWDDQRPLYCPCGPRDREDDGMYWGPNLDGYACRACAGRLPGWALERTLTCDMTCCYCGGVARGDGSWDAGYRLSGHPAQAAVGAVMAHA
jgi:hypothetical protein